MCGIAGFVGRGDKEILKKMTEIIAHRGPDDDGYFFDGKIGLGHKRLSIIDLASGHQPMFNENQNLIIIYNGEIYNYQEIKKELEQKGHQFKTNSDTEVIIHGFEEWQEKCVEKFNGMFTFVIWDKEKQSLFLARDRLGIKPLYYLIQNNNLIFASEIKSILEYPGIGRKINYEALDHYFSFRYTPLNDTIFEGIKKFPPASIGFFKDGELLIKKYWQLDFVNKEGGVLECEFIDRFEDSVKKRLISEVPLGAYLSGGIDSSLIVGIMNGLLDKPVETFSVGFENKSYNELPYANRVARYFKTNHHPFITHSSSFKLLSKIIWHLDEPVADAATIPTYQLSALTKKYATVILTGEGSDEFLAGYPKYKALIFGKKIKGLAPKIATNWLNKFASGIKSQRSLKYLSDKNPAESYLSLTSIFSEEEKEKLYTQEFKGKIKNSQKAQEIIDPYFKTRDSFLNQLIRLDAETWLPNDLLTKNDKMTMAHGVEARLPYLDYQLVEFMATLADEQRLKNLKDKYILRKAAKKILPKNITRRKKQGFTVPLDLFINEGKKILSKENIEKRGLLNPDYVNFVSKQNLNQSFWRRQFWTLLTFEVWCQVFLD